MIHFSEKFLSICQKLKFYPTVLQFNTKTMNFWSTELFLSNFFCLNFNENAIFKLQYEFWQFVFSILRVYVKKMLIWDQIWINFSLKCLLRKRESILFLASQSPTSEYQNLFINSVWSHCQWMWLAHFGGQRREN